MRIRALCCALLVAAATFGVGPAASAETSHEAQKQATALLHKVEALQHQTDQALQRYDAALSSLGASVTTSVSADQALGQTEQAADASRAVFGARVRALYRTGGPMAAYASVMDATSLTDALDRVANVQRVLATDHASVIAGERAVLVASERAASTRTVALASVHTERQVAQVADQLAALLNQQQQLLDEANTRVKSLREAEIAQARLEAARAAAARIALDQARRVKARGGPAEYFKLYHAAATTCPGLSWTVLAAIGQVESGHGADTSTSYAGAEGPMQFLPATFAAYAVDGDHDGVTDIQDPADAIYTAAHYLCANGAGKGGQDLYVAIWNYNHADWYVQMVLALAAQYAAGTVTG